VPRFLWLREHLRQARRIDAHLPLRNDAAQTFVTVFDRVFERYDAPCRRLIYPGDERGHRRRLSAARRSGEEYQTVSTLRELWDDGRYVQRLQLRRPIAKQAKRNRRSARSAKYVNAYQPGIYILPRRRKLAASLKTIASFGSDRARDRIQLVGLKRRSGKTL